MGKTGSCLIISVIGLHNTAAKLYSVDRAVSILFRSRDMLDKSTRSQVSTGRKFRALKIWLTMRAFGLDKIKEHIRGGQRLAQEFEKMVKSDDR